MTATLIQSAAVLIAMGITGLLIDRYADRAITVWLNSKTDRES